MKLLIIACALLAAKAAQLPSPSYQGPSTGGVPLPSVGSNQQFSGQQSGSAHSGQLSSVSSGHSALSAQVSGGVGVANTSPLILGGQDSLEYSGAHGDCGDGKVRHHDGTCVLPEVTQHVFVYSAPEQEPTEPSEPAYVPLPKVEHNIVFIKNEEPEAPQDPIIVPPPQKKHIIYVLNKESVDLGPKVIEVSTEPPQNPEVFFVSYGEGDSPTLPNGIDFETALNSAAHSGGQIIGGSGLSGSGLSGTGAAGITAGSSLSGAGTGGFTAGSSLSGAGTGGFTAGSSLSGTGAGGFPAGTSLSGTSAGGFTAGSSLSGTSAGGYTAGSSLNSAGSTGTGLSGASSIGFAGSTGLSGTGAGGFTDGSSIITATGGITSSSSLSIGGFSDGSGSGDSRGVSLSAPQSHYNTP